jgi:hypothetical protein
MRRQELYIFFSVIILIGILFVVFLLSSLFTNPTSDLPSASTRPLPSSSPPRPFDIPSQSSPSGETETTTKEGVIDLLPIQDPSFDIEYLSGNDLFVITIKQNPYSINQANALKWFSNQGLNPDILNIYWQNYPEVDKLK